MASKMMMMIDDDIEQDAHTGVLWPPKPFITQLDELIPALAAF
jgi:hypothetical protein